VFRWFHVRGIAVRDAQGRIFRWNMLVTDIDDRKMAEEKLLRDEQELRRMTDAIPQHIMVLAPDGTAVHALERDQTDTASLRHRRPRIFAALLAGIGLVLIVGGSRLRMLGGSLYYLRNSCSPPVTRRASKARYARWPDCASCR